MRRKQFAQRNGADNLFRLANGRRQSNQVADIHRQRSEYLITLSERNSNREPFGLRHFDSNSDSYA